MTRRLVLAAVLAAGLAAPAFADLSRLPGGYRAQGDDAACRLRLEPPAAAPQDSLVEAETLSGFVLAFPGCPASLSDARLWRAPADGSALRLIDGAGAVILEARPGDGRSWRGETETGADVTLSPS